MAYHDELLQQAVDLVHEAGEPPKQASLRRAVSAAYYALFHLLISETVLNWRRDDSRHILGRMFEHGLMKKVSARVLDSRKMPYLHENPGQVQHLRTVAKAFVQLQNMREKADYDNHTFWTRTDVIRELGFAAGAFNSWRSIRDDNIAQEYLVSLLLKPRD